MPQGHVKWFSPEKGFGFITLDADTEVFVHYSSIIGDGFRLLHAEELVAFDLINTVSGFQAKNVRRLAAESPSDDLGDKPSSTDTAKTG